MDIELLNKFNAINIIDSSSWKIPEALKKVFPGYNGAGCKIQMMLDYKTGIIRLLDILKENFNDQNYSKKMKKQINSNDLFLFDLGYSIPVFLKTITERLAFFISRFNYYAVSLYVKKEDSFHKIDILDVLKKLKHKNSIIEFEYYVGNKTIKVKIRFLAMRVPEEVSNQRRRKARKKAAKKGKTPSKKTLALCDWHFLMTNIPVEKGIDVKEIIGFYPIRWSIELLFRQLKSVLAIHKTEVKTNAYRLKCEILGKCIVVMFISLFYSIARAKTWQLFGKEISFEKTVKYFKRNVACLFELLLISTRKSLDFIEKMINKIIHVCQKNRQSSRKNSLDTLIDRLSYESFKYVKMSVVGDGS